MSIKESSAIINQCKADVPMEDTDFFIAVERETGGGHEVIKVPFSELDNYEEMPGPWDMIPRVYRKPHRSSSGKTPVS